MFIIIPGMLYYNISNTIFLLEESMFSDTYSKIRVDYNRECLTQYKEYLESNNITTSYITNYKEFYRTIQTNNNIGKFGTTPLTLIILKKYLTIRMYYFSVRCQIFS